eukprot:TRINITY_DN3802_c0_g1_i2.p2 TRINITY_DN3802_c0_g1~~TRINITY_DN3802_c0_g1_i2.p2  ORF type:complete len:107 (-),score=9.17 TRINITY_DN3802_c0_g1_i2:161-481(-)
MCIRDSFYLTGADLDRDGVPDTLQGSHEQAQAGTLAHIAGRGEYTADPGWYGQHAPYKGPCTPQFAENHRYVRYRHHSWYDQGSMYGPFLPPRCAGISYGYPTGYH